MSTLRLRSTILLFILPFVFFAAVVTLALQPDVAGSLGIIVSDSAARSRTPSLTPTEPPFIDITRADYEAALEKWRSWGIEAYEIAIQIAAYSPAAGGWKIRVNDGKACLISYDPVYPAQGETRSEDPDRHCEETSKDFTIERQFERIAAMLDQADKSQGSNPVYCNVHFNWQYGYPNLLKCMNKAGIHDTQEQITLLRILEHWGSPVPDNPTDRLP